MIVVYLIETSDKQWWFIELIIKVIPVSIVVYWMMILWLKQSDTCVNGGLLKDDYLTNVSIVVYWMMIFWLKQMCQ